MPIKDNDIYNPRLKTKQPHPYINNDANFFYVNDASSLRCLKHSYCRRLREHNIEHCIQINNLIMNIIFKQTNFNFDTGNIH